MSGQGNWTPEREQQLRELAGLYSASQIAEMIGDVTRSAVIGKIHRLGLAGRAPNKAKVREPRQPRQRKGRRKEKSSRLPVLPFHAPKGRELPPCPQSLTRICDLLPGQCRFPMWTATTPAVPAPDEVFYCGDAVCGTAGDPIGKRTYCAGHYAYAH